jgi:hypothetical protein
MTDVIDIQLGAAPWAPCANSSMIAEYRYHEVPLEGIVEVCGVQYLFTCIHGAGDRANWWIYERTDEGERAFLESSESAAEYTERVMRRQMQPPCAIALALEDVGIISYRVLEDSTHEAFSAAVEAIKREVSEVAGEARDFELV